MRQSSSDGRDEDLCTATCGENMHTIMFCVDFSLLCAKSFQTDG